MTSLEAALIKYGIYTLAARLGHSVPSHDELGDVGAVTASVDSGAEDRVREARLLVGDPLDHPVDAKTDLVSIFELIGSGETIPTVPLQRLSLRGFQDNADSPAVLFGRFLDEIKIIRQGRGMFESFCSLMAVYAWTVSATLTSNYSKGFDPKGISLADQFKAVTALAHCLERQDGKPDLLVVSGDLPGIQAMLYTITSRGVAKSLRGRSLYLQLLSDVVIRDLLARLELPWASVVYNAGSNFKLLIPAASENKLIEYRRDANMKLLKLHDGELYVALAWEPIPVKAIIDARALSAGGHLARAMERLSRKIEAEKISWFSELVSTVDIYVQLFGPLGHGGPLNAEIAGEANACLVCHADVTAKDRCPGPDGKGTYCHQCLSFEELAGEVGRSRFLLVQRAEIGELTPRSEGAKPRWNEVLKVFGFSYKFLQTPPDHSNTSTNTEWLYRIDSTEDFLGSDAQVKYGIRPVANLTPWEDAETRIVRDTGTMADEDAAGIHRYGVLRMDVDGLGAVFQTKLRFQDLLHTAALSAAITLFFEGCLNVICRQAAQNWRGQASALNSPNGESKRQRGPNSDVKIPYIIYSGGDDLFIVGCWDVLPIVAQEIREKLARYTSNRLTMSAGIALGHNKFPLYQAAEMAKRSLERSKAREVIDAAGSVQQEKDGITFLGMTMGWEQFKKASDLAIVVSRLILVGDSQSGKKAPRALLYVLWEAAIAYRQETQRSGIPGAVTPQAAFVPQSEGVMLGRWFWRLTYGLLRMAARAEPPVREKIMGLNGGAWQSTEETGGRVWEMINYLGLPVRWAAFLIRKEG